MHIYICVCVYICLTLSIYIYIYIYIFGSAALGCSSCFYRKVLGALTGPIIFGCKANNAMLRNKTPGTQGARVQSRWFWYLGFFSCLKRRRYSDIWRQHRRISAFFQARKSAQIFKPVFCTPGPWAPAVFPRNIALFLFTFNIVRPLSCPEGSL